MAPLGRSRLAPLIERRTSSSAMPYCISAYGSSSTRTAGSEPPPTVTSPTPVTWATFCASTVEARSYISLVVRVAEVSARIMIGACDGLILRYCGMPGRALGSSDRLALMAAWTSRAATLMSLVRSNITLMRVDPCELLDDSSLTPAMVPRARSSGVATLEAIVSGLAPGRLAETKMTGKSTCGSGDTANSVNATAPASTIERFSSVVATGRRMNGDDTLMLASRRRVVGHEPRLVRSPAASEPIEEQVDDRGREERQHLADEQASDHDDPQGLP